MCTYILPLLLWFQASPWLLACYFILIWLSTHHHLQTNVPKMRSLTYLTLLLPSLAAAIPEGAGITATALKGLKARQATCAPGNTRWDCCDEEKVEVSWICRFDDWNRGFDRQACQQCRTTCRKETFPACQQRCKQCEQINRNSPYQHLYCWNVSGSHGGLGRAEPAALLIRGRGVDLRLWSSLWKSVWRPLCKWAQCRVETS